jgi:hypothetical protein
MSEEITNQSNTASSVPNSASSSFQESYDFGGAMEVSGSMYGEDRVGRQLAISGGTDSDLVMNDMGVLLETYTSDNMQYPMQ